MSETPLSAESRRGRLSGKFILPAILVLVLLGVFVWGFVSSGCSTSTDGNAASQLVAVSLSVDCQAAVEAGSATALAVSDNGVMRSDALSLDAGTSVYDALVASGAALVTQGVQGSPPGVYVFSIDGLPEGEAGPQSGWKYYVNGSDPGMSCDKYVLSDGDVIEWRYVTNA